MITLAPWSDDDLPLLIALNAPELTTFLGGPETDEKVRERHAKYLASSTGATPNHMFTIRVDGERAGAIGYWEKTWRDVFMYETGWAVLATFQGRGIASAAARLIVERARADGIRGMLHAFPRVEHAASNAICRKAGFTFVDEMDFEYPAGNPIRCNDWQVEI